MLVGTGRVADGGARAATVFVVGGDAVVGHALELLLCGSGYDARFEALPGFDARQALGESGLILLAPGLDERDRDAILSSMKSACRDGDLPVLELVPATAPRPGDGHVIISWPCRTEDLERAIETALRRGEDCAGWAEAVPQNKSSAHDPCPRSG